MRSRDFAFWLQGYFEIVGCDGHGINLTPGQVKIIQMHLGMVFQHDPDIAAKPHPPLQSFPSTIGSPADLTTRLIC